MERHLSNFLHYTIKNFSKQDLLGFYAFSRRDALNQRIYIHIVYKLYIHLFLVFLITIFIYKKIKSEPLVYKTIRFGLFHFGVPAGNRTPN